VVKFNSKINIPCVDQGSGKVTNSFALFNPWKPSYTMENILVQLKKVMIDNKNAAQPADGSMY